ADLVPLRSYARSKGLKDEDIAFTASHKAIVNWAEVNNQFLVGETTFAAQKDIDEAIRAGFTSHEVRQAMVDVLLGRYGLSVDTNNWKIAVGAGDTSQAQAVLAKAASLKDAVGARAEWAQAVTVAHADILGWVKRDIEALSGADAIKEYSEKVSRLMREGMWTADIPANGLDAEAKVIGTTLAVKGQPIWRGAHDALFTLLTNPENSQPGAVRVFVDQWTKFVAAADDLTKGTPIQYVPPALADDAIKGAFLQAQKNYVKQVLDTGENSTGSLAIKRALDLVEQETHLALDTDTQTELQQRKLGESSRYSALVYTVLSSKLDTPLAKLKSQLADYQAEMGLGVTGFVNDATLEQLVRDYLSQVLSAPSDMAEAQSALNDIYGAGLREDGQVGFSTVSYLQRFQKEHHLWDSGQVDVTTLNLLRQEQAKLNTMGPFGSILRKDSTDASAARAIGTMQENLWRWKRQQLGLPIPALPTYTFDAVTEQMVKDYQTSHGLYASGVVDRTLYDMISGEAGGTSAKTSAPVEVSLASPMGASKWQVTTNFGFDDTTPLTGVRFHTGLDMVPVENDPNWDGYVRAAAKGKVIFSGPAGGYGNVVVLQHDNGLTTFYAHFKDPADDKEKLPALDATVEAGQKLGVMGKTGTADDLHVHFEVRTGGSKDKPFGGTVLNPLLFIPHDGIPNTPPKPPALDKPFVIIRPEDRGSITKIRQLQTQVIQAALGFLRYQGKLPNGNADFDGWYGKTEAAAVAEFQRVYGINPGDDKYGTVDQSMFDRFVEIVRNGAPSLQPESGQPFLGNPQDNPLPGLDGTSVARWGRDILNAAEARNWDRKKAYLLAAVVAHESGGNPYAVNDAGDTGLAQIVWKFHAKEKGISQHDLFNPDVNLRLAAEILDQNLATFNGEVRNALMAYNAGPDVAHNGIPAYADAVLKWYRQFLDADPS
ncbi:MAG TPA: peptidoglycan-binding protein, partial [Symbiobacteriaceae bacterium]